MLCKYYVHMCACSIFEQISTDSLQLLGPWPTNLLCLHIEECADKDTNAEEQDKGKMQRSRIRRKVTP